MGLLRLLEMALLVTARRRQGTVLAVAWACFTTMVLLVVHHHEPWFDEAQAWLIARDNSLFEMLFRRLHYEGTPGLWHVLLWVPARLGAPFRTISYLSALLASVSAGLVLFFAPFPVWLRVLFVFGYYPAYQYAVIARSYGLNLLLIILAAILYSTRGLQAATLLPDSGSTGKYERFRLSGCLGALRRVCLVGVAVSMDFHQTLRHSRIHFRDRKPAGGCAGGSRTRRLDSGSSRYDTRKRHRDA